MRKRAETRAENHKYMLSLQKARNRATQQTERHYLNSILFQQISPQLRRLAMRRKGELDNFLT